MPRLLHITRPASLTDQGPYFCTHTYTLTLSDCEIHKTLADKTFFPILFSIMKRQVLKNLDFDWPEPPMVCIYPGKHLAKIKFICEFGELNITLKISSSDEVSCD